MERFSKPNKSTPVTGSNLGSTENVSDEGNATPPGDDLRPKVAHSKQRVIGDKQRLSTSVLWEIQHNFYTRHCGQAWRSGTLPLEITSNPLIAQAYARVIYGFWKDSGLLGQPLRIVELGAGHGRFGYLFLREFDRLQRRLSPPGAKFRYVMTDMSERNLELLRSHLKLQSFVEAGVLEFACFDMEGNGVPHSIGPVQTAGPLAVIANYAFDSIPADAFYIENKQLFETLVTVQAPPESWPDWDDPQLLAKLCISSAHHPAQTGYYSKTIWNQILQQYCQSVDKSSLLFPVAALGCIERLRRAASDGFLLLAADKGPMHEDELHTAEPIPGMAVHADGCISVDVNFGIISKYFRAQGGIVLNTPHHAMHINVVAFLMGHSNREYAETAQVFEKCISENGPDDWFTLGVVIESLETELTLDQILAYLRVSAWNPSCFVRFFPTILSNLEQARAIHRQDLYRAVFEIWEAYYSIGEKTDIAFHLGVVLLEMGFCKEAMQFFRDSTRVYGPQAATSYNVGLCFFGMGQTQEALIQMEESLKLDNEYELAKAMRAGLLSAQENMEKNKT